MITIHLSLHPSTISLLYERLVARANVTPMSHTLDCLLVSVRREDHTHFVLKPVEDNALLPNAIRRVTRLISSKEDETHRVIVYTNHYDEHDHELLRAMSRLCDELYVVITHQAVGEKLAFHQPWWMRCCGSRTIEVVIHDHRAFRSVTSDFLL